MLPKGFILMRLKHPCFAITVNRTPHCKTRVFSMDSDSATKPISNDHTTVSLPDYSLESALDKWPGSSHSRKINGEAKLSSLPLSLKSRSISQCNSRSSTSRFRTDLSLLERVRDICDENKYPMGSLIPQENYVKAKTLFHSLIVKSNALVQENISRRYNQKRKQRSLNRCAPLRNHSESNVIADTINAAFHLLLRICREPWPVTQKGFGEGVVSDRSWQQSCVQYCKPSYTNLLFKSWKNAVLCNEKVRSAMSMTQLLQEISSNCYLRYDFATIGMVLQVALHESPKHIAPSVVQYIWDTLEKPEMHLMLNPSRTASKHIHYLYNALLKAHAESGNDANDVLCYMFALLDDMRCRRNLIPDVISYNILLRYIGRNNFSFEKFEFAIQMMQRENVQPDLATLLEAVHCCAKFEQVKLSEDYFQQMRDVLVASPNQSDVGLVARASNDVMRLYRTVFKKCKADVVRREIIEKAQALFLDLYRPNSLSSQCLFRILMKLYFQYGKPNELKSSLLQMKNPSVDLYGLMIKAYGDADKIDLAIDSFYAMIEDDRVSPNIEMFNLLLNALAESSVTTPDITERAFLILMLLNSNYRCRQLGLKPDAVTYNTFLKCLTKSYCQNIALQAEAILNEMDHRAAADISLQPNRITYNLAIRIALRMNDRSRVDKFIARMQKSNVSADTRLFNAVLNHYAQIGSVESARRAESLLIDMIEMGKHDFAIRPNVYSFNIVMNAWARSDDPASCHRMWLLYRNMSTHNLELDEVTYNTLISHFTKTKSSLCMADKLLQKMEKTLEYTEERAQPNFVLYANVIKAFLEFEDVQNATRLLFRAIGVYEKGHVRGGPSALIYHQIVLSWIKFGDIKQASDTVFKLHHLFISQKIPVSPHTSTYNALSDAWNSSSRPERNLHVTKIKLILGSAKD